MIIKPINNFCVGLKIVSLGVSKPTSCNGVINRLGSSFLLQTNPMQAISIPKLKIFPYSFGFFHNF